VILLGIRGLGRGVGGAVAVICMVPLNEYGGAVRVDIWSDVVCPWCYIGKRRLERALADFEHADEVEVQWRSFELDPRAPAVREGDPAARLARKYGLSIDQAREANQRLTALAAAEGLAYRLEAVHSGNSFNAHRLIHLGGQRGLQDQVKERFFAAYFCEGQPIGDADVLLSQAIAAGLDGAEVKDVLDGDAYADAVRADEAEAAAREITGVPYFLVDGRFAIPGAQEPDTMLAILRRAWAKRAVPGDPGSS
jgi:predicted DsbA family dithiol-disulfide isomerase